MYILFGLHGNNRSPEAQNAKKYATQQPRLGNHGLVRADRGYEAGLPRQLSIQVIRSQSPLQICCKLRKNDVFIPSGLGAMRAFWKT